MTRKTSISIPHNLLAQVDAHVALLKQTDYSMNRSRYICQILQARITQHQKQQSKTHITWRLGGNDNGEKARG